ncbi:MAG: DegT/DnrJ/EryC1/StrS family aminotransferase, partial [Mycobacteriales bacterium]
LTAGLADLAGLRTPTELPNRSHVWHQYTVLVTAEAPVDRDKLAAGLGERGIGHGIYYPHQVFDHACYREHPRVVIDDTPTASRVAQQCLSLPVHPALTDANLDTVIGAVREMFET